MRDNIGLYLFNVWVVERVLFMDVHRNVEIERKYNFEKHCIKVSMANVFQLSKCFIFEHCIYFEPNAYRYHCCVILLK